MKKIVLLIFSMAVVSLNLRAQTQRLEEAHGKTILASPHIRTTMSSVRVARLHSSIAITIRSTSWSTRTTTKARTIPR